MAAELYWRGRKNDHLVAQRKTQWRLAHKSSAGKARSSGYKNEKGRGMGQRHVRKSCVRFVVLAVSFSAVLSLAAQAATAPVGATPGSFSVDPNGGANYTIPIQISPGSAGMAPSIALTYSKQVDNPLVGVGFSISGLSIISRCGGTIALDGAKGGVYYDSRDRFCLDGQRLIAVNGADGAHGTEYRTERESFAKIFSYDTSVCGLDNSAAPSSGPACFKVFSKDGMVSEYGISPDSRIQAQGKTVVRLWALNKVQDTRGNYFTVQYEENIPTEITGEYRPVRIDYTGNAGAGLLPYNSVRFVYGPRTDIVPHYEAGSVIKVTQLLTNVQTYADATLVRSYNLAYDNSGAPSGPAGRSRLTSIQECGSDGVCLPATTLGWSDKGNGSYTQAYYQAPDSGPIWRAGYATSFAVDVNGDGKTDLVQDGKLSYDAQVLLSNGDGSFTLAWRAATNTGPFWRASYGAVIPADVNGDGLMDFIQIADGAYQAQVLVSKGDGSYSQAFYQAPNSPPLWRSGFATTLAGDIRGSGRADLVQIAQDYYQAQTVSPNGAPPDLLTLVTTGPGATTTITYKPLIDNTVYTKDSTALYPYQDVQNATYMVSNYTTSDGIGGNLSFSYEYFGAKAHLQGGGWLGFGRVDTTDELSGILSVTLYDQN